MPDSKKDFICEFPDCQNAYISEHSRRQHYRRFHKDVWVQSSIRRRAASLKKLATSETNSRDGGTQSDSGSPPTSYGGLRSEGSIRMVTTSRRNVTVSDGVFKSVAVAPTSQDRESCQIDQGVPILSDRSMSAGTNTMIQKASQQSFDKSPLSQVQCADTSQTMSLISLDTAKSRQTGDVAVQSTESSSSSGIHVQDNMYDASAISSIYQAPEQTEPMNASIIHGRQIQSIISDLSLIADHTGSTFMSPFHHSEMHLDQQLGFNTNFRQAYPHQPSLPYSGLLRDSASEHAMLDMMTGSFNMRSDNFCHGPDKGDYTVKAHIPPNSITASGQTFFYAHSPHRVPLNMGDQSSLMLGRNFGHDESNLSGQFFGPNTSSYIMASHQAAAPATSGYLNTFQRRFSAPDIFSSSTTTTGLPGGFANPTRPRTNSITFQAPCAAYANAAPRGDQVADSITVNRYHASQGSDHNIGTKSQLTESPQQAHSSSSRGSVKSIQKSRLRNSASAGLPKNIAHLNDPSIIVAPSPLSVSPRAGFIKSPFEDRSDSYQLQDGHFSVRTAQSIANVQDNVEIERLVHSLIHAADSDESSDSSNHTGDLYSRPFSEQASFIASTP